MSPPRGPLNALRAGPTGYFNYIVHNDLAVFDLIEFAAE